MHIFKVITALSTNGNSSFLTLNSPAMDWNGSILAKLLFCFMDLANEVNKSFSRLWHSLLWPVGELELPHGSGLPVLQNESHTPNHRGGCQEDSDSAQAIKAGMIFSKTGKKKLETCLTRKSVTFISYQLLTLSRFHIYLNCKLIYSHKMSSWKPNSQKELPHSHIRKCFWAPEIVFKAKMEQRHSISKFSESNNLLCWQEHPGKSSRPEILLLSWHRHICCASLFAALSDDK